MGRYQNWRKSRIVSLVAAAAPVTGGLIPIPITDASVVSNLNEQGEGRALLFTDLDGNKLPHHLTRGDFPFTEQGIWTWYSRPESVYANGIYYWFPVNEFGEVLVCWYKVSDGTSGETVLKTLTTGVGNGIDDHNNGSAIVLADGKLLVFYSDHGGAVIECRKQTTAGDPTAWDAAVSLGVFTSTSYVNPVQLSGIAGTNGGAIYCMFRDETANYERRYVVSTDAGATWSAAVSILKSSDDANRVFTIARPYMHWVADSTGTKLYFVASDGNPPEVTDPGTSAFVNSIWAGYFDVQANTVHKSDGTVVGGGSFTAPPVGGFETASFTLVLDGYTRQKPYWNWGIEMDANDRPVICCVQFNGDVGTPYTEGDYVISRWTGSAWASATIDTLALFGAVGTPITSGVEFYYYGGIAIHPDDPTGVAYVSNHDPDGGTDAWSIWKIVSSDGGATWTVDSKVNMTRGGERRCIRPVVPRHSDGEGTIELLYPRGHYKGFQDGWTGGGTVWESRRYATGIDTFPKLNDSYIAYVKKDLVTSASQIEMHWDRDDAAEQSDPDLTFVDWLDYPRDVHVNKWNTRRLIDMANRTKFTVIWVGRWGRAAYHSIQHHNYAAWTGAGVAGFMLREQAATSSNQAFVFNTTSGTFGSATAFSIVPAVQTWHSIVVRWQVGVSSNQIRPNVDGVNATGIAASGAPTPATSTDNYAWLGWSAHTNGNLSFHGKHGFAAVIPEDMSDAWIAEFSAANPFKDSYNYATFGDIQEYTDDETPLPPAPPRGRGGRSFGADRVIGTGRHANGLNVRRAG